MVLTEEDLIFFLKINKNVKYNEAKNREKMYQKKKDKLKKKGYITRKTKYNRQ